MLPHVFAIYALLALTHVSASKEKRQVTYQGSDVNSTDDYPYVHVVRPATKKPLPAQVVYPGDLSNFYVTESSGGVPSVKVDADDSNHTEHSPSDGHRSQRSVRANNPRRKNLFSAPKYAKNHLSVPYAHAASESRLHSSITTMNEIPAEMYFDGAGFLRYEDDSVEQRRPPPSRYHVPEGGSKTLKQFQKVFNLTNERSPSPVKYDDDPGSMAAMYPPGGEAIDHGAQETANENPYAADIMSAYQKGILENMQMYDQFSVDQKPFQQDAFAFPSQFFQNHPTSYEHMASHMSQPNDALLQNHKLQSSPNVAMVGLANPSLNTAQMSNPNYPAVWKRSKRSLNEDEVHSASDVSPNRFRFSRIADQQDASSRYIPISGNYNGEALQLNFPVYDQNPMENYPPQRPPMQNYHSYPMPIQPQGRQYGGPMERFFHHSEARRYSYGILGSGNFEVIRGGVFPNQGARHQGYNRGYQDQRIPYEYGNYGPAEIILDGPIQGFQGFDSFPAHLINALSKHSELVVRPERNTADRSAEYK